MKSSAPFVGFLQAAGVGLYVTLFVFLFGPAGALSFRMPDSAPAGPMIFLMLFVFSALVCGGLVLGYPVFLFSEGKKKLAIHAVAWSAGWLFAFLVSLLFLVL